MNWDHVEGNWKQFKGAVRERWGKLTDNDLDVVAGKREQLAGTLQKHYGYAKETAEKEIDAFLAACPSDVSEGSQRSHEKVKTAGR